ncbi:hypothetical protein JHK86_006741 [Glycine max]|nr:hypothetical protein JHK86_006741 [Glycine max]
MVPGWQDSKKNMLSRWKELRSTIRSSERWKELLWKTTVQSWREALREAAGISGVVVLNSSVIIAEF